MSRLGTSELVRTRKTRHMEVEQGIPKGHPATVETLDVYEKGSLERLLKSRISIAEGKRRPMVRAGMSPEYATIQVADPYEPGARLVAARNVRNDPLGRLHSHRQIDDAQFYAGRAYQNDWEEAERGAKAIDPTKEAVDGGRLPEPLTNKQGAARNRLVEIERVLGRTMHRVAHAVLIEGMSMEAMALKLFSRNGQVAERYYGRMFRDALNELAKEYGLATK